MTIAATGDARFTGGRGGSATGANIATLQVRSRAHVADDVITLELGAPAGGRLRDWTPGSHIDLVLPNGITRQYSLCGNRWDPFNYRVGVLLDEQSRGGSSFIHTQLQVGDLVGVGGPRNNFPLVPSERYLFVAGGIGITPLVPMVQQAAMLGADWQLLYGGRRRGSMAFVDELAVHGSRVHVCPEDEFGRLDLADFLGDVDPNVRIYCCGPPPLLAAVERACEGWPLHSLRTERFIAKERGAPVRNLPFEVELVRTGRTVTVPADKSILDVLSAAGVDVLSSCRQGTCGTCETTVLAGRPDHRDALLDDEELDTADYMYVCVSRSATERLVLDV